jgi:hypothetical protein
MADMMRRVTELAMGIRGKKEDERDEQFVDRLERQMRKSMDPDEMGDFLEAERKAIGLTEMTMADVIMRKELRGWVARLRNVMTEEQDENAIRQLSQNKLSKAKEVKKEVKVEADFGESSGEEKDWDREVQFEEDHTDESDKEQCLWEKDHGQPDTAEDDVLSELSENQIQTKMMFVEVCCSEKSRLTDQARKKGWRGVRVTQRNNVYRPRTLRKLRKLLDGQNLREKCIERVHSHLSLPCTPFSSFSNLNLLRRSTQRGRLRIEHQRTNTRILLTRLTTLYENLRRSRRITYTVSFEWPLKSPGWKEESLMEFETPWND